ncbi:MAG: hypothetical protein PWQ87_96 [Candidatus Woesearchaeota archaeon]|nr:hypothetical protein [Candidatus Woesearchaeota archaeon]
MLEKNELKNIGGWLLFFIITLVFINPIFNLFIILSECQFYTILEIIESFAFLSLSILAGIFLWTKKPFGVKFTKIFLITTLILNIANAVIFLDYYLFFNGTVYFIIWILYLNKSERVKQTYGNLKETQRGMQIWPILSIIYAFLSPIFGIIFAIISLNRISKNHKLKGMGISIIALIIGIVILLLSFGYGILISANFDYVPEDIEMKCSNYCYYVDSATQYFMEYSTTENGFMCYCLDDSSEIVEQKVYPYTFE